MVLVIFTSPEPHGNNEVLGERIEFARSDSTGPRYLAATVVVKELRHAEDMLDSHRLGEEGVDEIDNILGLHIVNPSGCKGCGDRISERIPPSLRKNVVRLGGRVQGDGVVTAEFAPFQEAIYETVERLRSGGWRRTRT